MKNKKRLFCAFVGIISIVVLIVIIVINNSMFVTAEYSSTYNQTFGEFTADTASMLLKDKEKNFCYSPVSLFGSLSMLVEVSEGNAQKEVLGVLGFESVEELESNYEQMLGDIAVDTESSKITLANSFWLSQKDITEAARERVNVIEEKLDCDIFLNDCVDPIQVNGWVKEKTNGLIPKVLDSYEKDIALINTVYYKSGWNIDICEESDKDVFYLDNGNKEDVKYLSAGREKMYFKIDKDYTFVEVPLESGEVILVLPDEGVDLNKILTEKKLNEIMASATNSTGKKWGLVNIRFPKFEISNTIESGQFETILKEKGISELWGVPNWVEGIEGQFVELAQKTKIVVDEDGIEAAAATSMYAVSIGITPMPEIDLDITYDRPFLYILMKDAVPLFIGTVYNPAD